MLVNPYIFGIAGPPGAIDAYTAGLFSAIGLTLLIGSAFASPAIRVRRSNDNAEQDIGFTGTALDTAALASFVGSNSAYVKTWYDQSGGGNHFTNATTADQPRIVDAGTYDAALVFSVTGSTGNLKCANVAASGIDAKSIFRKVLRRGTPTYAFPFEYGDGSLIGGVSGDGQIQFLDGAAVAGFAYMAGVGGTTSYSIATWGSSGRDPTSALGVRAHVFHRIGYTGIDVYADGALQTRIAGSSDVGSPATGNFPAWYWRLGARSDGNSAEINMTTCVIYDADKSSDAAAISAAIA